MTTDRYKWYLLDGWRPYAWIASAIVLLYSKSIFFGYTYLDDNALILKNISFLSDIGNIGQAFLRKVFEVSYLPYYRPMLTLSFIFDAQIGGASPAVYHASNILYHIVASSLVFTLLTRLGYARLRSFAFAAIFAVHPVLSQGTAWIPGRNDTLLAVFILTSFLCFMDMLGTGKRVYYALHIAAFLAALMTKETALVLLPVCLIYLRYIARRKILSRAGIFSALGWCAAICAWYALRRIAVAGSSELNVFEMAELVRAYLPAAVQFAGKAFFPFNLSVFPIIPDTTFIYGIAAMVLLAFAVIATKTKRYNFISFGLAWAVLFILPSLIRAGHMISADFIEHRVYVPIIGISIVLLETDIVKKAKEPVFTAAALVIVLVFSVITFVHIDNFRDRLSFWGNAVRTSPDSSFAHLAMGQAYYEVGRDEDAGREYRRSLAIEALKPASLYGLGELALKRGSLGEAEAYFMKTIAVYPCFANAYTELGVVYYKQGRLDEAEWAWQQALRIEPNNVATIKFLAIYYYKRQDRRRSAEYAGRLQAMGLRPPREFLESLGMRQD